MTPTPKKRIIALSILAAWIASVLFIGVYYVFVPTPMTIPPFTQWAAGMGVPVLSLIIGVGLAARHRFFVGHIDGTAPEAGSRLDLILRYNQNTLEQVVIFAGATALALALMPELGTRIVPALSLWFGFMRIAFYQGYKRRPALRAFGFAGTFHPSVVLFFAAFGSLFLRHV